MAFHILGPSACECNTTSISSCQTAYFRFALGPVWPSRLAKGLRPQRALCRRACAPFGQRHSRRVHLTCAFESTTGQPRGVRYKWLRSCLFEVIVRVTFSQSAKRGHAQSRSEAGSMGGSCGESESDIDTGAVWHGRAQMHRGGRWCPCGSMLPVSHCSLKRCSSHPMLWGNLSHGGYPEEPPQGHAVAKLSRNGGR